MGEFTMPSLGADMDSGKIVEWRVGPGDAVRRGDIVAVVATDKADVDVEIFDTGVVEQILVPEGVEVAVGTPLATISSATAAPGLPATPAPGVLAEPAPGPAPAPLPAATGAAPAAHAAHGASSPVLRRLARHLGVDLDALTGTGPGGTVTRDDVEAAATSLPISSPASAASAASDSSTSDRDLALRGAIARLMARSKREIPHYYLADDLDFSHAQEWLLRTNAERDVARRLLPAALLLKAVANAARAVPALNGFWRDDRFEPSEAVHVGVAISTRGGGLLAPAIRDADRLAVDDVMAALRDLVARTRSGRLRSSEMADPTITVTNLGDQSVRAVFGVIYPPQVALVGFGAITPRPWADEAMLGIRPVVTATLAADHRASDGHTGARFLTAIHRALETPENL
jgi:pyruvate dehydrogenase E2 component (dihydrolipoamide acetyltransferase)